MDPGTALAVVQISASVLSIIWKYYSGVKDAKKDIERLEDEITVVRKVFQDLKELLDRTNVPGTGAAELPVSELLVQPTHRTLSEIQELEKRLNPNPGRKVMNRVGVRALKWPLKKKEVDEYIMKLERYKTTVISALQIDQIALLLDARDDLSSVKLQQSRAELDRQLSKLPIADGAAFNSRRRQHEAHCLKDTRVELLDQIHKWSDKREQHIFWLSGVAGSGKSTIASTIANSFLRQGCLAGSFFFSRGAGDLGHAGMFVTTLARQLADLRPAFKSHLSIAIANHESLIHQGLSTQWEQFFLDPPLKAIANSSGFSKLVFVIDALDECDCDEDIKLILKLFFELKDLQTTKMQIFLTSRPETVIRLGFSSMPPIIHEDLNLGSVPDDVVERDISAFLTHELHRIGEEHNLPNLLNTIDINALVRKCDLLFIYATTLCRFIDDKDDVLNDRLSIILQDTSTENPALSRLDDMYTKILEDRISKDRSGIELDRIVKRFQRVIGSFVLLSNVLSAPVFSDLLHIHICRTKRCTPLAY